MGWEGLKLPVTLTKGALSSMMDCMMVMGHIKSPYGARLKTNTKGWVCEVAEKGSDWLGSYTGPHTKEVWTSMQLGCATRIRSLMGKAAHLCRV